MSKKKKPTPKEIKDQSAKLRKLKPMVRAKSLFGDDHHAGIDAQIEVLEQNLSDSDIDDRTLFEDDSEECAEWPLSVSECARAARQWMDGEFEDAEDLVASWKELIVNP